MQLSPRVLNEARRQALFLAQRMTTSFQQKKLNSWADLERIFALTVPEVYKTKPWSYSSFSSFRDFWKHSFETRLTAATITTQEVEKIKIDKNVSTFNKVTLFPEQEGCYKAIRDALFVKNPSINAVLQDGGTGLGKTYVASAVIAWLFKEKKILEHPLIKFRPHPVMIFTPKGVVEHWKRILDDMGLSEYVAKRKIFVFSNGEFLTDFGNQFCDEEEDPITGEVRYIWKPILTPFFTIADESHNFIRPGSARTKKLIALINSPLECKFLFMSATPGEKVNDLRTFVLALKNFTFNSMKITEDNFSYFAALHDNEPSKPNIEGMKRLRKTLSPYIFSLPYVKPKHKAINMVWLVDFASPSHAKIYASAHERYIKACERAGKNTAWGRFERFIELNNYRKTVEPLRAPHVAERAANNYKSGLLATAIGGAYKEFVAEVVFQLVDKYNIPREHISLIWGGKRSYASDQLLSREEIEKLLKEGIHRLMGDPPLLKRVRLTLKHIQDQHEHDESPDQQAYRHNRLKELKLLGKQSDDARQEEIDKFQTGETKICIFTLASGGVGLSLDRDKPFLLPREGLFTPVYNGKEFQQVLGRLVRRASLSDAKQYVTMMKGTVEQFHVAPILDVKMKSTAALTNRHYDIVDLLSNEVPIVTPANLTRLRSELEATLDAERDDTIVNVDKSSDDDEDDEINPETGEII